ncbi:unnamed protein product [Penicillium glandicola]
MVERPVGYPSYINQTGGYSPETVRVLENWWTGVRVLNSIISVLTVPVVTILLAHASIVYSQRCQPTQKLSLQELLALADRGWSDPWILFSSRSTFLWIAFTILIFNAIQQPIQSILVSSKTITIVGSADIPVYQVVESIGGQVFWPMFDQYLLGWDPEPADLANIPVELVIEDVLKKTTMVSNKDTQPYLWPNPGTVPGMVPSDNNLNGTLYYYNIEPQNYFISAMQNGTSTGVLREHAIRFNMSLDCRAISSTQYPETCAGDNPFQVSYQFEDSEQETSTGITVRACVPGNYSEVPWTLSRDRQDISEEAFLDVQQASGNTANFTLRCSSNTTRGYFELGNTNNGYRPGRLIEKWPSNEDAFNDIIIGFSNNTGAWSQSPTTVDVSESPFENWQLPLAYKNNVTTENTTTPGPLTTSFMALFGERSFFNTVSQSASTEPAEVLKPICQQDSIPFARYCAIYTYQASLNCSTFSAVNNLCNQTAWTNYTLPELVLTSLQMFNPTWTGRYAAQQGLLTAMYFSIESYLLQTQSATSSTSDYESPPSARPLFSGSGTTVTKPVVSTGGKIAVSILLSLQLLSLVCLACYIYSVPTWSVSFNSYAVLRMGSSLRDLPTLGPVKEAEIERLKQEDGLIGVIKDFEDDFDGEGMTALPRLGLGAPGLVNRAARVRAERDQL